MNWTRLNPLSWTLPLKIVAGLAAAFFLYMILSGVGGIVWARHIANAALKSIARTISDYDAVDAKATQDEQAVSALARQTQELEKQVAAEQANRAAIAKDRDAILKREADTDALLKRLLIEDANRPRIASLPDAVAAINKALKK